jgi:hypothetical protein
VAGDLNDIDHDEIELHKPEQQRFLRMVYSNHPCESPWLCDFGRDRVCRCCGKKSGPSGETLAMKRLAKRIEGGLPIGRDDLSAVQWEILARLRQSERLPS